MVTSMKRGRPKGSKNKPRAATRVAVTTTGWAVKTEKVYALCVRIIELEDELKRLHAELRRHLAPSPAPLIIERLCSCGLGLDPNGPHPVTCSWWSSGSSF